LSLSVSAENGTKCAGWGHPIPRQSLNACKPEVMPIPVTDRLPLVALPLDATALHERKKKDTFFIRSSWSM